MTQVAEANPPADRPSPHRPHDTCPSSSPRTRRGSVLAGEEHHRLAVGSDVPFPSRSRSGCAWTAGHRTCPAHATARPWESDGPRSEPGSLPRRPYPRMAPVVLDHGRIGFVAPAAARDRPAGQLALADGSRVRGNRLARLSGVGDTAPAGAGSPSPEATFAAARPTPTPSPVPTEVPSAASPVPTPAPSPTQPARTYKVKPGDTLSGIAARFGTTVRALVDLNDIKNPSRTPPSVHGSSCHPRRRSPVAQRRSLSRARGAASAALPLLTQSGLTRLYPQRWQPRQYEVMKPPALTSVMRVPQRDTPGRPCHGRRGSPGPASRTGGTRARTPRSRLPGSIESLRTGRPPPRRPASNACGTGGGGPRGEPRRNTRSRFRQRTPWFRSRFFSSPWCRRIRDLQTSRSRRVVGVRALRRVQAGHALVHPGGHQVDLAHLGRVAIAHLRCRVVGRHPVGAAGPGGRIPRRGGARPEPEHDRGLGRELLAWGCQLEAASEHRVDDYPVAIQIDEQELAASCDPLHPLPVKRRQLRGGSAHRERPCLRRRIGTSAARRETSATTVRSGKLGHGRDCSRENSCARLSRPREAGQPEKPILWPFEREGADRGNNGTTDHLIVTRTRPEGAQAVRDSPGACWTRSDTS